MSITESGDNPYAVRAAPGLLTLPENRNYAIDGKVLCCRSDTTLPELCWMTGSTNVKRRRKEIKRRVTGQVQGAAFTALTFGVALLSVVLYRRGYQIPYVSILFIIFGLDYFCGRRFKLVVSQSEEGIELEQRGRRFLFTQLVVLFTWIGATVSVKDSFGAGPGAAVALIAGGLGLKYITWLRERWQVASTRIAVRPIAEDLFEVHGLSAEFLRALQLHGG